jgi:hypothetical protein
MAARGWVEQVETAGGWAVGTVAARTSAAVVEADGMDPTDVEEIPRQRNTRKEIRRKL